MANQFDYVGNINFKIPEKKVSMPSQQQYQTPMMMSVDTTIGRVKPQNPFEDEDMLWAAYDMLNGESANVLVKTYPKAQKKLNVLASFLTDAYNPEVETNEIFDAYPEISENVKTKIYARIKPVVSKQKAQMELEQEPLTVWEKAGALWLWITQWVSTVWQNIIGKPVTSAWEWLWEKLKDTKFAKFIQQKAVDFFGEDAVRAFAREEQMRKERWEWWEKWNIFVATWKEKLWESWFARAWEAIGKEAAIMWLTAWAWWIAAWATRAAIWWVWLRWLWAVWGKVAQIARWAVAGWAGWVLWTEISTLWKEWRLATKEELKTWAIIWTIAWWLLSNKITPTQKQIWNTILPKMTPTELSDRWLKWLVKTNAFGKVIPILSKQEQEMVKVTEKIISPTKSNVANLNKILWVAKTEWNKLKNVLVKNKTFTWDTDDVISRMDKVELPVMLKADATMEKAFDLVKSQFRTILDKHPKTAAWLLTARQEFDDAVRNSFPNLYTSETLTPMKSAITLLRKIPNDVLDEWIWWSIVKNSLKKQSLLLDVADNLSTKLEWVWTTKVSRWYKKYGDLIKAAIYVWWWAYWWVKLTEFIAWK